ncbi:MAG: response regulator transcription factor [Nitrospirales bacterium]
MRILLVEDDSSVSGFIVKGLREERYAVDLATDGETGLSMAEVTPYDVIILDVMLPKMNGFDVCRRLRAKRQTTPILLLTARDAVEDRVAGLDTGADDYLTKPFAFAELLARIRALLRRGSAQSTPHMKIADLELDPISHRVWRAGQDVLTNKEYSS